MPPEKPAESAHPRKRRKLTRILVSLLILVLAIGGYLGYQKFQQANAAVITDSKAHTYEAFPDDAKVKHFDASEFTFDLPDDWKLVTHVTTPQNKYSYQSTKKNFEARTLDIYVDNVPADKALNRVIAVKAQGARLSHGEASENCTSFAVSNQQPNQSAANALVIKARWDGVEFLCDNDSKYRNVMGTTSAEGINKVTLTGAGGSTHTYFFVYTDHSSLDDKTIFYKALETFKAK